MIKSVTIKNFLSHKKTRIRFAKGLNVICGKSEAGKSAIGRAINWVVNNRPLGNTYHSHWSSNTSVSLKTNNNVVKRVKTKTKNNYYLNGDKFTAFGSKIPDEINKALRISEINIQRQFTLPFLFSLSNGEISRYINKLANIESIDGYISGINKILSDEKREIEQERETYKSLKKEVLSFEWVHNAERDLDILEGVKNKTKKQKSKIVKINNLINEIETENKKLSQIKSLSSARSSNLFKRIIKTYKTIERNQAVLVNISDLNASVSVLRRNFNEKNDFINKKEPFLIKKLKICPLCQRKG